MNPLAKMFLLVFLIANVSATILITQPAVTNFA